MIEGTQQAENFSNRLKLVENMVYENKPDYQPAIDLCKKYKIGRSFRDRLVREGVIKEYRLLGKIYFKESQIIAAMEGGKTEKAAA